MFFARWRKSTSPKPAPKRTPLIRRRRPQLECLEDRCVPSTFHVALSGSDAADGSEAHPFGSVQHAINAANSGDTILLAGGTYGFNAAEDKFSAGFGTTAVAFIFNKQLTIKGGYST